MLFLLSIYIYPIISEVIFYKNVLVEFSELVYLKIVWLELAGSGHNNWN